MKSTLFFYILILFGMLPHLYQNRLYLKMKNMKCFCFGKSFAVIEYCHMKPISRHVVEFSLRAKLQYASVNNLSIYNRLSRRGFFDKPILEFTVDACAFMRNKRRNPLAQQAYDFMGLAKHSNINHTCPFSGEAIVDKLRWDARYVMLFTLPTGEYNFSTTYYAYNKPGCNVSFAFQIYHD